MALPNDKISTTLVANTLGTSSRDVGTLCTHQAINKWSKWKPIRKDSVTGITYTDLVGINFGMGLPSITPNTPERLKTMYQNGTANWVYRRPRGGNIQEPYRIGDFRNYNHYAVNPMGGFFVTPNVQNYGSASIITGSVIITNGGDDGNIGFDELAQEYQYLGMALFNDVGAMVRNVTSLQPNTSTVEINATGLPEGDYKAIMFLANQAIIIGRNITSLDSFPISLFNVKVQSTPILGEVKTTMNPKWLPIGNDGKAGATLIVNISNTTANNNLTFNNVTAKLRYTRNSYDATMENGETMQTLGTVVRDTSTPAGRQIIFTLPSVDVADPNGWVLWWRCTGTLARTQSINILTPTGI